MLTRILIAGLAIFGAISSAAGESAVADAAMAQDHARVRELTGQRADVNAAQVDGTTALHWAAHWEDVETADLLIRAGATAKAPNRYGMTALLEAASNGNAAIVQKLLAAGADANSALPDGPTALMAAARTGKVDAVKALLDQGANVNARENIRGQTALMWAAAERHADVVQLLVARGADVHARADVARDPAYQPKVGPTQALALTGMTALLYAARQNDLDSARVLLGAKAGVNERASDGTSPLLLAVLNVHYKLAKVLLENGADPNLTDGFGRGPLYAVIDLRNFEISSRPAPPNEPGIDHVEMIQLLLSHGANANLRLTKNMPLRGLNNFDGRWADLNGATAFLRAAQSADLPVMKLLLANGADPRIQTVDHTTGLMLAAGVGFDEGTSFGSEKDVPEAIRICMEAGDDVNAVNDLNYTAMHGAAYRGANSVVKLLADMGAKPDVKSKDGTTPEDLALGHKFINGGFNRHEDTAALVHQIAAGQPKR